MAGQKFQYDENGGTFFYFLLSFLALVLIPGSYYFWPRQEKEDPEKKKKECRCQHCLNKERLLKSSQPWKTTKEYAIEAVIIIGWIFFAFLAYRVSQFDYEYANFDPYDILGISLGSSQGDIKKAYRKLSLIYHPDKETGDEKTFMKLTKAYQALTDDEARRNWEKYGNPDGPSAMDFGIALPSWIVEKENSVWVLGLYALVFMVALPTVVGMWWYKSIRYSGDQVLLDTTQMYYYFFHKTPSMVVKRALMILAASLEFESSHNKEIQERPTDNEELPTLMKYLPNLNEKNKERPLCFPYSIKARALLHAHLMRLPLPSDTLDKDRNVIVKKCPYLIQEMVSCVAQLIMLAYAGRIARLPTIETIENVMKLSPMIVQAMFESKNPLLQLPHITEDALKYFVTKKRHIKTIQQFAQQKNEDRRSMLRNFSDAEYEDVLKVLSKMPYIDFQVKSEVVDDELTTVYTAGAIITITATLTRYNMETLFGDETVTDNHVPAIEGSRGDDEEGQVEEKEEEGEKQPKKPVWAKQQKKTKKPAKKTKKAAPNKPVQQNATTPAITNKKSEDRSPSRSSRNEQSLEVRHSEAVDEDEGSEDDSDTVISDDEESEPVENRKVMSAEDDDAEWEKCQKRLHKREKLLEGKSKMSHSVHCPFFPEDKQEYWWVYLCDRKSRTLLTPPYHVTNLVRQEEVQLKFTAPNKAGIYTFTVCLRPDSYLGLDQTVDLKFDVKEAPEVPKDHPQWDIPDEEEEDEGEGSGSSAFATDDDDED